MSNTRAPSLNLDLLHSVFARRGVDAYCEAMTKVVIRKLWKKGVRPSKKEILDIWEEIRLDPTSFKLPPGRNGRLLKYPIRIGKGDLKIVEKAVEREERKGPKIFQKMVDEGVSAILPSLRKDWPKEWRRQQRERDGFEKRLYQNWAEPLSGMRHIFTISAELVAGYRERIDSDKEKLTLWEVITRLHARGMQTADEIYSLLRTGFASCAVARWRTLHEISVVSRFIMMHGEEASVRYVDYRWIEAMKRVNEYSSPFWGLTNDPTFQKNAKFYQAEYERVLDKYGKSFREEYGWAAHFLGTPKTNFRELERVVRLDHYRSHYMRASAGVHAAVTGTYVRNPYNAPLLLMGPTDKGLAWPGRATIQTLLELNQTLTGLFPSLDAVIAVEMVDVLVSELEKKFKECESKLDGSVNKDIEPGATEFIWEDPDF